MKILICGMPRSMTTWAFNAVLELLAGQPLKTLWIEPKDAAAEAEFAATTENVLAKCHHHSDTLANAADCVVYSYRDIRTAAVSYFRKFSSDCSLGQLDVWVQAGHAWVQAADVILRYEQVEREPLSALQRLKDVLGGKYGMACLVPESNEALLARIDSRFAQRQMAERVDYDPQTMILPGHRTFQPPPDALNDVEKVLYERIEQTFKTWLVDHNYLRQDDHGQTLDYRFAAGILAQMDKPVVLDVGAERGSFIEQALGADAERVIAFEALPRHVEYLRTQFAGEPRVEIRPQAASDHSGKAFFHIALDPEGRELDYHHTLADLGDSVTVVRSARTIEVATVALGELANGGDLPSSVDFLKIDTDGHDLSVLRGLDNLRPRFIFAEYWDTLPETSGRNLYTLAELDQCAKAYGYHHCVVVRRHGRLESLEWDAPWTLPGDWGNVLFVRDLADLALIRAVMAELAPVAECANQEYVATLVKECEAKEAEIRRLDNTLKEATDKTRLGCAREETLIKECEAKEAVIQNLDNALQQERSNLQSLAAELATTKANESSTSELTSAVNSLESRTENLERAFTAGLADLANGDAFARNFLRGLLKEVTLRQSSQAGSNPLSDSESNLSLSAKLNAKAKVIGEQQKALLAYREGLWLLAPLLWFLWPRKLIDPTPKEVGQFFISLKCDELVIRQDHVATPETLIAYEDQIRAQSLAVTLARFAYQTIGWLPRIFLFNFLHIRAALRPRLGNLNQHPPQQLNLPSAFVSSLPADKLPSIGIVTPSFRQSAFIERTLRSVLDQNYPKLEYYVQDGGSKDGTVEILQDYAGRLAGWQSEPDGGQSHAINLGFAQTGSEIMAWLNSDDLLLPGALNYVGDYFARHPEVDVVYGHRILIDEEDKEIGRWVLPAHEDEVLSWVDFVPQETLFWRRTIWEKAGGQIDENFRFAMDWDLLLRFRDAGARMVRLPRFLGAFRIHEAQKTSAVINEVGHQEMDRLRQRSLGRTVGYPDIRRAVWPYMAKHVLGDLAYRFGRRVNVGE